MAGLTAARVLAEKGHDVTVLEARDRVGGRIHTVREHGEIVELGAEFVHGRPAELMRLVEEAGEEIYEIGGENLSFEEGRLVADEGREEAFNVLERLEGWAKPDISFAEYLEQAPLPEEEMRAAIGYVEGFNAADHRVIGVESLALQQAAEEQIEGDKAFRLRQGYDRLTEFLAGKVREAGGRIVLKTLVERVEWSRGRVQVSAACDGVATNFTAERAVIALPLGVLQQGSVVFVPEPVAAVEARRLRMGSACRFTLVFREPFWQKLEPAALMEPAALKELSFLFSFGEKPRVWWTAHPAESSTLTGWSGGPEAVELLRLSTEDLRGLACRRLADIFSAEVGFVEERLLSFRMHNWTGDPLTRGAYSYVPAGALDASSKMTIPELDTLYFAGEHTDTTGHWGTVHAAMRSGMRAAAQINGG